jgi:DNA polymerase-3 subunit epsilon
MAAQLAAHPDYRVLRRLDPAAHRPALVGHTVRRAAIVDTETTGTDPGRDRVIELAIVVFEYCHATGAIGRVLDRYDALDDARVADMLAAVGIVIAHNAGFDRRFLETRLPLFEQLPWACSWQEVPWAKAGIASSKLEYLAYRCGFFYEAHRAEADCHALLQVLAQPFGSSSDVTLRLLLDSARSPSFRLWANQSPFETKDVLRQRGYRWDSDRRCWSLDARSQQAVQEALEWMRDSVYAGKDVEVDLDEFDAKCRYSARAGRRSRLRTG